MVRACPLKDVGSGCCMRVLFLAVGTCRVAEEQKEKCQRLLHQLSGGWAESYGFWAPWALLGLMANGKVWLCPTNACHRAGLHPPPFQGISLCGGEPAALLVQSESAYQRHCQLSAGIGSLVLALCEETESSWSDACVCNSKPWLWHQHVLRQRAVLQGETLACCRRPRGQD